LGLFFGLGPLPFGLLPSSEFSPNSNDFKLQISDLKVSKEAEDLRPQDLKPKRKAQSSKL
jgi:hypothetical protein